MGDCDSIFEFIISNNVKEAKKLITKCGIKELLTMKNKKV